MNLSQVIYGIRWLIRDTFRQARRSGLLGVMLIVSGLAIALCLSIGITGPKSWRDPNDPAPDFLPRKSLYDQETVAKSKIHVVGGSVTVGFGAVTVPIGRDALDAVRFVQVALAFGVADTLGILLALIWTGGFLPGFLDPSAAAVLLAKPIPRWALLLGKFLGVLIFVATQAVLFIGGTWLALGIKTGIWDTLYLLAIPILLVHFTAFYSFSAVLAVTTRSTVACAIGSVLFWFACWGINLARCAVVAHSEMEASAGNFGGAAEISYWILPKPADMSMLLYDGLQAERFFGKAQMFDTIQQRGQFYPDLSIATTLLFAVGLVIMAAYEFSQTDY